MAKNPYDRRRGSRERDGMMGMTAGIAPPRESPVAFEDLEALAYSARRRGLRESESRHEHELRQARREGWDEGREAGVDDGRDELLRRIDERFGEEVRAAIKASREMLEAFNADERKVPKRELAERVERHAILLDWLVHAHHGSFFEELPF